MCGVVLELVFNIGWVDCFFCILYYCIVDDVGFVGFRIDFGIDDMGVKGYVCVFWCCFKMV